MKSLALVAALLLATAPQSFSDGPPSHSLLRIFIADDAALRPIWSAGIDFEGSSGSPGGWMEFVASPVEMRLLDERGIAYEVTELDLSAAARRTLAAGPTDALGFGIGSMGGYYTLAEVGMQLDSMKIRYPGLITGKQVIGNSIEGRPVWAVRISDNPDTDEPDEPQALYTALIHAREPAGMMTVVYYMWWLLDGYGTDPMATWLVDNRQLWFIPVINADGYAYNESTNPSGGGFWRKNRRNNGDGSYGIDLNRNYGPDYMWDAPNGGSSTVPASDTYRGTGPFSEPETQTIDTFMRLHSIRVCLNYHTYGRYLIYPYGYTNTETADSTLFREFGFNMTRVNRYTTGTDQQTVNYSTRGNSDDYMYGDTTKSRTYAMTPEAGTSFWPPTGQILPIALENLQSNIYYSAVAGAMPVMSEYLLSDSTSSSGFLPGGSFGFQVTIRNQGLADAPPLSISFATDSGELHFSSGALGVSLLPSRADTTLLLSGTVDAAAVPGTKFLLFVNIAGADGYTRTDTATLYAGEPVERFADDFESGTGLWFTEDDWGLVADGHSGIVSMHDSPAGPSAGWSTAGIEIIQTVSLQGLTTAKLEFWTKWAIQPIEDFAVIKISTNGGVNWSTLRTPLTNAASGNGTQTGGTFGYDGYTPAPGWVRQEADLTAYTGSDVVLRFELDADGGDSRDGWYIDDVRITGYREAIPGGTVGVTASSLAGESLSFGEWPGATDGIDAPLGESELGPPPSPGTFDARWAIPPTNGSLTDIRPPLASAADTNVFTLALVTVPSDYPLALSWDRGTLPPGSWRIMDSPAGTGGLNQDLWQSDAAAIGDPSTAALYIVHALNATTQVGVRNRWSMVSLPVSPVDSSVAALFPDALSSAFAFDEGYLERTVVSPGTGYWIKNDGNTLAPMSGVPHTRQEVANPGGGWKLIGSIWCPVLRTAVCPSCDTTPIIFGYRDGYFIADTLYPGEAYWYRGSHTLILDCAGTAGAAAPQFQPAGPAGPGGAGPGPFSSLSVSDGGGGFALLRFTSRKPAGEDPDPYMLPPAPPDPAFDARFETESAVEYFDEGTRCAPIGIRISNQSGDVVMTFSAGSEDPARYALEVSTGIGDAGRYPLSDGVSVVVPAGSAARLLRAGNDAVPSAFRVYGNYPNPFNPVTSIRYDLGAPARITLRVRNLAGRDVDVPVFEREMPPGRHTLRYDAGGLSSGVYFYTLSATGTGPEASGRFTGKFILVK